MLLEVLLVIGTVVVFLSLGITGWFIGKYNTFRVGQQDIKTQLGNIRTEYQRRADLFYNLVQAVKSHKKFEKSTLVEVTRARGGNFGTTPTQQLTKMKQLDGLFAGLRVVFERYPTLLSHKQHDKLMDEVRITEDRINVARTDYNEIVGDYNKQVQMFPSNIVAGMFRFSVEPFFENEPSTTQSPKIDLE